MACNNIFGLFILMYEKLVPGRLFQHKGAFIEQNERAEWVRWGSVQWVTYDYSEHAFAELREQHEC